ncbi:MAG: choice-of-anchor J domain-containing protein [Bacteroidales bacterium]|nr:choice-of-anchor J domain-containing protein [Bacteroidales bacterium]
MRKFLTILLLLATMFPFAAKAEQLTVCDGSAGNSYVPFYSGWADDYLRSQMVYPASMLADMAGTPISGMKFYANLQSANWTGTFQVYMAEYPETTISGFIDPTTATTVYTGKLAIAGGEMVVTFTAPFNYAGGNLLIGFDEIETGNYVDLTWEGQTTTGTAVQGKDSGGIDYISPHVENFLPKVTFDYVAPFSVSSTVFGPRPNNAWMEPATVKVLGTGYEVTAMNIENDYFTFDGPAVPFTTPKTFAVTTGNAASGDVTGQMTLIYEGLRAGQVVELKATAYDPIEGDVFETAPMLPVNFTNLDRTPDCSMLYHNYNLPGEASEGKDVVYKLKFTHDVILKATISTSGDSKAALYPQDFGGEDGPMKDNAYKYTGTIGGNDLTGESGLYVTAGIYYLVAQADDDFTLNLNTTEATPLQAYVIYPSQGVENVSITDTYARWILGDYTEEMQVLLGTEETLTDDDALIPWTSQLTIPAVELPLVEGETYYLQVNERNAAGETKGETVSFTTIINAPDNLLANGEEVAEIFEGDVLNLTWDYTTTNPDLFIGFNLYKDGVKLNENIITENEYEEDSLEYNMSNGYYFYVKTVFSGDESANFSYLAYAFVSGNGTAKGHVFDQDGETPLEGATLTFTGKDEFGNDVVCDTVTTNEEGFYTADIKVGTYKVKASLADFEDATDDVTIIYGAETEKDFIMSETQYKPTEVTAEVLEDGAVKVEWTMDRSLQGFNVYMRQTVGDGIVTDKPKVDTLAENITATTWYHNDWKENPAGVYQYGVEALYSGNHNPSRAAEELTIYADATEIQMFTPVYTYYGDTQNSAAQFVVPASQLTDMVGGEITSMKFYTNPSQAYKPQNISGPTYAGYMTEVDSETLSTFIDFNSATNIFNGNISLTDDCLIIDFATPYTYNGGNLAIAFLCTNSAGYCKIFYYSAAVTGGSIYRESAADPVVVQNYIPKTTFNYEVSPITWSDTLQKDMFTEPFTFKVSTNDDGQSVEGAHVTMTNVSEPEIAYGFDMDATGEYQIVDFRRGVYNIEVEPAEGDDHDAFTAENVNLWKAEEYEATLNETALTVEKIYVSHTGYAMWDEPKAAAPDRGFKGYNLYVDGNLLEGEYDKTYYKIDCIGLELVDGEQYTFSVGVAQNNEPDPSYIKDYDFTYSECGNYSPLSDPNYYSPEPAVECNNVLVTWGIEPEPEPEPEPDEFKEGFENGLNGWTSLDADGDGYGWKLASTAITAPGHNNSADFVFSQSYVNNYGPLYPDNYLVSPQKYVIGGSSVFSIWACGQDASYAAEHFGVAISEGGTSAADFVTVAEWTIGQRTAKGNDKVRGGSRDQSTWKQYTADLSAYAGKSVWIAIRHFNCTDQYFLDVDDVELSTGSKGEIARSGSSTLTYDFEDGTLQGWTAMDADGDGHNWYATSIYGANGGSYAVASESYNDYVGAFTPDNYLVSPQVTLGAGASISFYEKAYYGWEEPLYLMISTTETNPSDFTLVQGWSGLSNASFEQKTVDLSAYAGQQVYIAFHHTNSYNQYAIVLDDIEINLGSDYPGNPELTRNSWALYLDGKLLECVSKNIRHYEMPIEESGDHTFKVVSIDDEYNMSCGEEAIFTAGVTTKPDSLAATVENNGIKLSWVGNSSEYKVYKGWAEDDLYEIETVETAEEYFDPQLKACWYGVSGVSECGESPKAMVSSSITDEMHWNPQISWFTGEMTVTGVVSINNKEQFNSDLEIGAFINGECCGSARGLNLNGRSYFKFQVHGDDATQVVTFKVYDHSEDIELGYVSKTTLNFAADTIVGSVDDPSIFKFISTDEHCMVLAEGYNWVSTYIELSGEEGLDIIKAGLGANAQQIGSNLTFTQYFPADGEWYGPLNTAESEEMYVIKMSEAAEVCFTGMVADPEEHSVTLVKGWNWIGFISRQEMDLATALGTITPSEGDLIKSQDKFATYGQEDGWSGSLETMKPGQGYKYKQNGEGQQILTYPVATRVESVADNASAADSHWTVEPSRFAMNMSVTAAVSVDGNLVENGDIEVGAFCNGEVRGSARPVYVEALDRHVIFLTVFGNEGDNITFRLFNAEDGSEYTAAEHLVYSDDAIKGGIEDPFMLNFGGDDNISVFPNPTKGNVIVSADGMKNISVVNTLGQTVYRQAANAGEMTIDMSQFGAGMYLISIETENGTTVKHITVTR